MKRQNGGKPEKTSVADFDFYCRKGGLHVIDHQLAKLIGTSTTRLNERLKRKRSSTDNRMAVMSQNGKSGPHGGGRTKPSVLYGDRMIETLDWEKHVPSRKTGRDSMLSRTSVNCSMSLI